VRGSKPGISNISGESIATRPAESRRYCDILRLRPSDGDGREGLLSRRSNKENLANEPCRSITGENVSAGPSMLSISCMAASLFIEPVELYEDKIHNGFVLRRVCGVCVEYAWDGHEIDAHLSFWRKEVEMKAWEMK